VRQGLLHAASALNAWIYRLSGGRFGARFAGAPVCLLTTTGRRSGRTRTVPLLYLADDGGFVVVASQGGAPRNPGWYHNLQASPRAVLQIGRRRMAVTAHTIGAEDRERLWPRLVALYHPYEDYRRQTTRVIPLVRLTPESG
jgi:deazaflavin-dependent oxidoreductase (nitroreductase family)